MEPVLQPNKRKNAESRIRTHVGTKPIGPKPIPFGHSGISANVMSVRYQKLASQYLRTVKEITLVFKNLFIKTIFLYLPHQLLQSLSQ